MRFYCCCYIRFDILLNFVEFDLVNTRKSVEFDSEKCQSFVPFEFDEVFFTFSVQTYIKIEMRFFQLIKVIFEYFWALPGRRQEDICLLNCFACSALYACLHELVSGLYRLFQYQSVPILFVNN